MKKILSLICLAIVLANTSLLAQKISVAEYFFDQDPGVGKGTAIVVSPSADSVDISGSVSTTGLSAGFHVLGLRAKNINGTWSLYASRQFYLDTPPPGTIPTITAAEYFFDSDPGVGKATAITVPSPGDSIDVNNSVSTTGLGAGFHVLAIRVRNTSGIWSLYASRQFYLDVPPSGIIPNITAAEYFFDADPGVGKATAVTVTSPGDSIDINSTVSTVGLSLGFHRLVVRVKNANNIWGLYDARVLYIDDTLPTSAHSQIVKAESFFDTDPGIGSGTDVTPSFAAADSVDLNRSVSAAGLLEGNHYLYVRVQNQEGNWSLLEDGLFNVCNSAPPVPQFTDSIRGNVVTFYDNSTGDTSVLWNFGDGDTSTIKNATHAYSTPSTYTVTLIVYNSCLSDTITHLVTAGPNGVINITGDNGINVFPNPNDGNFTLSWRLASPNSEMQLADLAGRIIYSKIIPQTTGVETISVPTLSSGIYYWRMVSHDKIMGEAKVIVLR